MPRPSLNQLTYIADPVPSNVAAVNGSYTGTTAGTLFDASATQRLRIKFLNLSVFVGVTLGGNQTAGDYIIAYDSVVTAPICVLGICPASALVIGTTFGTSASGGTTFTTAATVYSTGQALPHEQNFAWPRGYTCTAAGNDIKFALVGGDDGAIEDVSTGVIRAIGTIGYDLV